MLFERECRRRQQRGLRIGLPLERQPEARAHRTARAVRTDEEAGPHLAFAQRCLDADVDPVVVLGERGDPGAEGDLDLGRFRPKGGEERLRELPGTDAARRALLIESIELAAGERLAAARRSREVSAIIDDGRAWLSPFTSMSADEHRRKLDAAAAVGEPAAARTARDEAKKWAEDEARRQDGARIRAALVSELQGLGYEVDVQGPEWTDGTRITVARPSEPNYDVQLSAIAGGQVQSKVRSYDHAGRSAGVNRRDVEVEQNWCDDLAKLNKLLAERGIGAEILREDGPGTAAQVPLKARSAPQSETGHTKQLERKA